MPEADIEIRSTDSVAPVIEAASDVVFDTTHLDVASIDSIIPDFRPIRRFRVDTFNLTASDYPYSAMDTTYLDSCLSEEAITVPDDLRELPHMPVSAEELAYDSMYARLTNVGDTVMVWNDKKFVSIKEQYKGFEGKALPNVLHGQFWFAPLLFAVFFCYGLVYALRSKSLSRDTKEFFTQSHVNSSSNQVGDQKTQYRFALVLLGAVCMSVFVVQAFHFTGPSTGPKSYLMASVNSLLLTLGYLGFKYLSSAYVGYVFVGTQARREWQISFRFLFGAAGIVLFPVVACMAYAPMSLTPIFYYIGIGALILAEILLVSYIIRRFFKYKFSILYLFLYLCTLEFLPLAALLFGYYKAIATV